MTRAVFVLFLTLGMVQEKPAGASGIEPMAVLSGAVKEFFAVKTLEAKLERTMISGVGRKKSATFVLRYRKSDAFVLESLDPIGYVQAADGDSLVAWNMGAKRGFKGSLDDVPPKERDRLLLGPGFGLNPLIPLNPRGYDMDARGVGKNRIVVKLSPRVSGYPPLEVEFLKDPYRVAAVRIDAGEWRSETTYADWREINGGWVFGSVKTVKWEDRLQTEEHLRYYDFKVNEALPDDWLPTALPADFERVGREFFVANVQ